jgi:phosphohistidine phosphatase
VAKSVYLIRHAKSSWADPGLADFDRPLNKRGKRDAPEMGRRLAARRIIPQLIVSSPAKRAKMTAVDIADAVGYRGEIRFDEKLYLGALTYHLQFIAGVLSQIDSLFLVGHNNTITELAEHLTGKTLTNVPTCGIVGIAYDGESGFSQLAGDGRLLFFDFPKKYIQS